MSEWKAQNLYLDAMIADENSQFWISDDDCLSRVSRRMAINIFSVVNSADLGEVNGGSDL